MLVKGARQSRKSALVRQIGSTLDDADTRKAAQDDPRDFVTAEQTLIIDEAQRVPELFLAIKSTVDSDSRPGRFLLTGSARLLSMRAVPDLLPGRVETIELWPLSQGEIDATSDGFVDALFTEGPAVSY
ncbi:AAA family ATPase [Nesterenkonia ebinurensis]|uniref:AAA family ATPase n=1 Tax=Nesterenkonia ebinurensis TaxID=2608252 RepID=UPI0021E0631C|nr:AAA family ATPase [Nesterenkonia ebinurensis]